MVNVFGSALWGRRQLNSKQVPHLKMCIILSLLTTKRRKLIYSRGEGEEEWLIKEEQEVSTTTQSAILEHLFNKQIQDQ